MSRNPFLTAALNAADNGWRVFPIIPGGKSPAIPEWQRRATTNTRQIYAWWADYSRKNIGITTGSPSGIVVVDLDAAKTPGQPHGRQSLAALARDAGETIPRHTRTVVTPSGGQHLYFRLPPEVDLRNTAGHLGRHVDTRGSGGYVVGPGSVINGRRYRLTINVPPLPIPGWLLQELLPKNPVATPPLAPRCSAYVDAVLRGEAERVEQAVVGTRNHTLFRAAARLGSFVAQGLVTEDIVTDVLEHACRHHTNFDHREVARTITSGLRHASRNAPTSAVPRGVRPSSGRIGN